MGKYRMQTVSGFLSKKRLFDKKKDPVWVYLENEMKANISRKPYNEKVGTWLKFLKDLKFYEFCKAKSIKRRLERDVGPVWYVEFSSYQREVLGYLKLNIRQDLIKNQPTLVRQSLADLGITMKFKKKVLLDAMRKSAEDVGIFMWELYKATYKKPPSDLLKKYTRDAMIMMSSLVFIDLEECTAALDKLTEPDKETPTPVKKKMKQNYTPNVRYGVYLQKTYVHFYSKHPAGPREPPKPLPFQYDFRIRSADIEKRRSRFSQAMVKERVCDYKFWDPPANLRSKDKTDADKSRKMKMIKLKAKAKFKSPYANTHFHVGGVSFTGYTPNYIVPNVTLIPTGYLVINGGVGTVQKEWVTIIHGHWVFPRKVIQACDKTCNCIEKWTEAVGKYLEQSKCKCNHLYDLKNEGSIPRKETFFIPPTKHGPYQIDLPRIYQMDPMENFIKECVSDALRSESLMHDAGFPTSPSHRLLLESLLADLAETSTLFLPHLPEASYLKSLLEWIRKRLRGKLTAKEHKRYALKSERSWLDLKHMDFRARAYYIPFTMKQLEHITWNHRGLIQELFYVLLDDFISRNRIKQLEQTRLWWPTTFYDAYPSKAFLDCFYTYMPGRVQDTFLINPYSMDPMNKFGPKPCPIGFRPMGSK